GAGGGRAGARAATQEGGGGGAHPPRPPPPLLFGITSSLLVQLLLEPHHPARQETDLQFQRRAHLFLLRQLRLVLGQPPPRLVELQRVAPGLVGAAARHGHADAPRQQRDRGLAFVDPALRRLQLRAALLQPPPPPRQVV